VYTATIRVEKLEGNTLILCSNNRTYLRYLELLCRENNLPCVTTVEVTPKVVKFKGLNLTPAEAAKADAKADIKAAEQRK